MQCTNHLKQLALGAQNFHDIYQRFPGSLRDPLWFNGSTTPTFPRPGAVTTSIERVDYYAFTVSILPFVEQTAIYDEIRSICQQASDAASYAAGNVPDTTGSATVSPGGGTAINNPFFEAQVPCYTCPSDKNGKVSELVVALRRLSYRYCHGDIWTHFDADYCRGMGACTSPSGTKKGFTRTMASVEDGTSNTIIFSESAINAGTADRNILSGAIRAGSSLNPKTSCLDKRGSNGQIDSSVAAGSLWDYKGLRMGDGRNTLFQTILPPNSPSCQNSNENSEQAIAASSYHTGGVNAALVDGSVRFVSQTVDAGSSNVVTASSYTGNSNYGVWGAMGSINGGESKSL